MCICICSVPRTASTQAAAQALQGPANALKRSKAAALVCNSHALLQAWPKEACSTSCPRLQPYSVAACTAAVPQAPKESTLQKGSKGAGCSRPTAAHWAATRACSSANSPLDMGL